MSFAKYVIYFILFSFIGYVIDTIYRSLQAKKYIRGTLFPMIAPIYGFSAILLLFLFSTWEANILLQILVGAIGVTLIELLGGIYCTNILKRRLWNYSKNKFNLFGHIDALHFLYWIVLTSIFRLALT